jgi:putative pre-16S rRNA nuclease
MSQQNDNLIEDLLTSPAHGLPLLGMDLGTKTIGLAICDSAWRIATPLETIKRTKFMADAKQLKTVCQDNHIGGLILGLPLNMDATEGPRCQATRAFARNLAPIVPLPLAFWDERLSTQAVTRTLLEADTSRKRRSELVDKLAATYILQGAIDRLVQFNTRSK